jgi:predicted transcriptional regulator
MTKEDKLKEYIKERHGTVKAFCQKYGFPYSTVSNIFARGVDKVNVMTVLKVCDALGLSASELAKGNIVPKETLNSDLLELSRNYIHIIETEPITLEGIKLSENERKLFKRTVRFAIDLIEQNRNEGRNEKK